MKDQIRLTIAILGLIFISNTLFGQQKFKLATEYYNSGEYEKAAQLYESLYKENTRNKNYFNLYIQCLLDLKEYTKAGKIIQDEIKKEPSDGSLYVTNGNLLERQGQPVKATIEYRKAIDNLNPDPSNISNLASTFTNLAKYDLAIETYLKGEKLSNIPDLYVYNLADLYRRQGDIKNMIKYYLITAEKEQNSLNVQTSLQRFLTENEYIELQKQIYHKIQEKPDISHYGELLQWTFIQKKNMIKPFVRPKHLIDNLKRMEEGFLHWLM
ncbi:MAG: tetratricopeptide repeat protein [Saprospiraceae bacterium]|nr:tetratricopeptide repeat protein [Saprospiraceae bacterium]